MLVDFKNAFNLVDRKVMLQIRCPFISRRVELCYSSPARLYYGEHTLLSCQGVQQGDPLGTLLFSLVLHALICILAKGDPRSRLASVFLPNIARPFHGVKLLGGPGSVDFDFSSQLVMKRVIKSIDLMDTVDKINDPQCELLLLRACAGISKLYFSMRTCSLRVFERAQCSFDVALRSALECIVTASGPGFGDWQWRLATLPFAFGGLGVYSAGDILNYAFLASRLQSASLQTMFLRHSNIVTFGLAFNDALNTFNSKMEIDRLCNPSKGGSDLWVRTDYEWVFAGDIYCDNAVSCAAGKEVDIGLGGGRDKPLRPADMLLYSWDRGMDVCVDLTGSSPLTQTWMVDFVSGRVVIEAAQRKRVKYETKCADTGYGFLPFSFSSFGELEKDAVALLKRIRKFYVTQDIGARAAIHIFNRISFAIAKGVGAQIVSRLPTNFL
nr:hypothetical protein [Tanacetum cinerariifolium]